MIAPVLLSEIASPATRGAITSLHQLMVSTHAHTTHHTHPRFFTTRIWGFRLGPSKQAPLSACGPLAYTTTHTYTYANRSRWASCWRG
jgi:hypothetical protein